jgi:hypothetical protein
MSNWTAKTIRERISAFMASSGPAVIFALPIILISAIALSNSITSRRQIIPMTPAQTPESRLSLNSAARARAATPQNAPNPAHRPSQTQSNPPAVAKDAVTADATGITGADPQGSALAERSAIRARLRYERITTDCEALAKLIRLGGLHADIATAVTVAESIALRRNAKAPETGSLVQHAVQDALIASGASPKDALEVVVIVQRAYADCKGDRAATEALDKLGALIRTQLKYSQPSATAGPGTAPIGNPVVPVPGGLGTATYLQRPAGR